MKELLISGVLIVLTVLLLNPFNFWMPNELHMMMLIGVIIVFILFATFIWKEKSTDERHELHKAIAGRFAYLTGSAVLVLGIVVQSLAHNLDPWLILALSGMVVAKIIGFIYSELHH